MTEQALSAEQVAQRLARIHASLHTRPGMTEREIGRVEGAADLAAVALRQLARVPGVSIPDHHEAGHEDENDADVLPFRRHDDTDE